VRLNWSISNCITSISAANYSAFQILSNATSSRRRILTQIWYISPPVLLPTRLYKSSDAHAFYLILNELDVAVSLVVSEALIAIKYLSSMEETIFNLREAFTKRLQTDARATFFASLWAERNRFLRSRLSMEGRLAFLANIAGFRRDILASLNQDVQSLQACSLKLGKLREAMATERLLYYKSPMKLQADLKVIAEGLEYIRVRVTEPEASGRGFG
jgi:hypothetical protein